MKLTIEWLKANHKKFQNLFPKEELEELADSFNNGNDLVAKMLCWKLMFSCEENYHANIRYFTTLIQNHLQDLADSDQWDKDNRTSPLTKALEESRKIFDELQQKGNQNGTQS